jgi:hypothetical protein
MTIRAELADGSILEFPDGTSDEVIQRTVKQQVQMAKFRTDEESFRAASNPASSMSGPQRVLAGIGRGMTELAYRGPAQILGLKGQQEIDQARQMDAPLMSTRGGATGNVLGQVATALPTMLIPGANTLVGAGAIGGGVGALSPTATGESRMGNAAMGAAGGVAGQAAGMALSRVLNPQTSKAARQLLDDGITPTPGQILGGGAQRMESAMESLPVVGQGIKQAKGRAVKEFNMAAINRALSPIGQRVDDIGHAGMQAAKNKIDDAYAAALTQLPKVDFDQGFDDALRTIQDMTTTLPADKQAQFASIIKQQLTDKMTPAKTLSGESFKQVESGIKRFAREFRSSPDFDQRQLGDALNAVVAELRDVAARNSPKAAEALKQADSSYAMLLRLEKAASMQGTPDGVFSAAQLGNAVRGMDNSLRKGAIARGQGLMQDMTTAGRQVLGESLPNSGTADRLLNTLFLGGGYAIDPMLAGAAVTGRGLYTTPAQKAIAALLAGRPMAMRKAGDVARIASPALALTGTQAALNE